MAILTKDRPQNEPTSLKSVHHLQSNQPISVIWLEMATAIDPTLDRHGKKQRTQNQKCLVACVQTCNVTPLRWKLLWTRPLSLEESTSPMRLLMLHACFNQSSTSKTSGRVAFLLDTATYTSIQNLVFKLLAPLHSIITYLFALAGRPRFLGWDPSL